MEVGAGHGEEIIITLTHSSDHKITDATVEKDCLLVGENTKQSRRAVKSLLTGADI